VTDIQDSYLTSFSEFDKKAARDGQAWLRPIRHKAILRFTELGFPTTRDEDWRFTDVSPIATTPFASAPTLAQDGHARLTSRELERFTFPDLTCSRLVFVNGRCAPELSSLLPLPDGVRVSSLGQTFASDPDLLEEHLARYADFQHDAFTALNTAFMADGGFVHIPKGVVLQEPIHLLYVSTETAAPTITHPRNLIVADENSQATVVEQYVSLTDQAYFSNAVTEAVVGQNSVLSHCLIDRESQQAFSISTLEVRQASSSNVVSHSVLLGGALVRNNVHLILGGEGGGCLVNGLFMPTGRQHMDNYMKVEHVSPHCDSRQFYNGLLNGRGRGVFHGRIVVHEGAQKTNAKQTNRNLLLSEDCRIDTKPQLEIHADDVKCTHGATIGQLDEDALFYLRARGIAKEAARAMLLLAFASENLNRIKVEPIRVYLEGLARQRLRWARPEKLLEGA